MIFEVPDDLADTELFGFSTLQERDKNVCGIDGTIGMTAEGPVPVQEVKKSGGTAYLVGHLTSIPEPPWCQAEAVQTACATGQTLRGCLQSIASVQDGSPAGAVEFCRCAGYVFGLLSVDGTVGSAVNDFLDYNIYKLGSS